MAGNPTVVVDFVANTRDLSSGVSQASRQTSGFGASLKSMGKAGALAAGAAGIGAVVATLKIGIDEYAEASKVAAQTNAVIKSTGGAANVTAKHVSGLAEQLMKKSGVDDEAIASGENLLLTFTNIRNEAGKGNDVFDQTTKAALDMSVALGTDMTSSAQMLGKALNDPIAGVSKLTRAGVTFTEAQKEQIAKLQESGNLLGAQKVILGEVRKEFGGSAEAAGKTLPGQLNILKQTFSNLAGELVAKMVPVLQRTISWLKDHWPEINAAIQQMWNNVRPALLGFGQLVAEVAKFVADNWSTIGPVVMAVAKVTTIGFRIIGGALQILVALLRGDWSAAWQAFKRTVEAVVNTVKGLITAYFGLYKSIVSAAWNAIKGATSDAWNGVRNAVRDAIERVKDLLRGMVDWIANLGRGILASALGRVGAMFDKIGDGAREAYDRVRNIFNDLVGFVNGIVDRVANAASKVANAIKSPINAVIRGWNALGIPGFSVNVKIPGPVPDVHFRWGGIGLPDIPQLAKGGVISSPTLAMVGEGRGREIVAPESLLREIAGGPTTVRVFIGETELRGMVRAEIVDVDTGIARTLLAGRGG